VDILLENMLIQATQSIGTDPQGWDKPMTEEETLNFMKFNNADRLIETVNLAPRNDGA
jgi:hypothetical protein